MLSIVTFAWVVFLSVISLHESLALYIAFVEPFKVNIPFKVFSLFLLLSLRGFSSLIWYLKPFFGLHLIMASSTNSSVVTPSSIPSFTPQTFTIPITLKLSYDNFLPCKQQVLATFKGFKLLHFLDTARAPPCFLSATDVSSNMASVAYVNFEQQDQLIVAWLLSSMDASILTMKLGLESSSQI